MKEEKEEKVINGYENPCDNCPVNTKNGGNGICVCSSTTLNLYR